nr:MAG TPA: hypothetical protein [Caudoviricetes sp.]
MKNVDLNKDNNKNISKTDNEKQMGNLNIEGNKNKTTMNKTKTVDKSKTAMNKNKNVDKSKTTMNKNKTVDKSKSKNIINNNINKIIYNYKQNIDNDKKKIQRPGLTNRENDSIIKFKAMIVGEYSRFDNCVTIINLHRGKEYLADHTQLFLNESLEEFTKRNTLNSCLIHATGKIKEYARKNGDKEYSIELLNNDIVLEDDMFYCPVKLIGDIDFDIKEFYDELMTYEYNSLLYLVSRLRHIINELTAEFLPEDFIYHYILNQYSLNSLSVDLYKDELQNNTFTEKELYEISILLGNVIFDLKTEESLKLLTIFRHIVLDLNAVQGITIIHKDKYVNKKANRRFTQLCQNKNISFGKAMMIVINRSKNFNIENRVDNVSYNDVLETGLIGIYYADK